MTQEVFIALVAFCTVGLFTPGPNNMLLMSSGANFGLRRTLPHLAGVAVGFPLMIVPVGLGAMQLFDLFPASYTILKVLSVAYLAYLAWKIANADAPKARNDARPMTFVQALAFQWVNPKGWSMALGAITLYAASRDLSAILWVSGAFLVIGTASALTWVSFGTGVRRLLTAPGWLRAFNWTMAALLVASILPVLTH